MASGKKGAKGNKTAHVLNLLTAPGDAPPPGEAAEDASTPESAQSADRRPLLPPILEVAQANDDNLAQQIQQALEDEFSLPAEEAAPAKEETSVVEDKPASKMSQDDIEAMLASMSAPAQPEPEPAPVQEPPAPQSPSGGKMSQDDIEAMLASMSAPAQPEPEPAPVQEPPAAQSKPPASPTEDISYTNIMQTLVEEKAPRYIKMFGLCTCKHCEADVKALTLSNLVPKYVVLSKQDMIPMLTVYEGRYNSTIIAQLTRSCKTVMDHPHHER
jgi:hypothetical protein